MNDVNDERYENGERCSSFTSFTHGCFVGKFSCFLNNAHIREIEQSCALRMACLHTLLKTTISGNGTRIVLTRKDRVFPAKTGGEL